VGGGTVAWTSAAVAASTETRRSGSAYGSHRDVRFVQSESCGTTMRAPGERSAARSEAMLSAATRPARRRGRRKCFIADTAGRGDMGCHGFCSNETRRCGLLCSQRWMWRWPGVGPVWVVV